MLLFCFFTGPTKMMVSQVSAPGLCCRLTGGVCALGRVAVAAVFVSLLLQRGNSQASGTIFTYICVDKEEFSKYPSYLTP